MDVSAVEAVVGRLHRRLRRRRRRDSADSRRDDRRLRRNERGFEPGVLAGHGRGGRSAEGVVVRFFDLVASVSSRPHLEDDDDDQDDGDDGAADDPDDENRSGRRRLRRDLESAAGSRASFSGGRRFGFRLLVVDVVLGVVVLVNDLRRDGG